MITSLQLKVKLVIADWEVNCSLNTVFATYKTVLESHLQNHNYIDFTQRTNFTLSQFYNKTIKRMNEKENEANGLNLNFTLPLFFQMKTPNASKFRHPEWTIFSSINGPYHCKPTKSYLLLKVKLTDVFALQDSFVYWIWDPHLECVMK